MAIAMLLVSLTLTRFWSEAILRRWAKRTLTCMLLLAISAIALRLLLLFHSPIPIPSGADDFSYVLLGDTLFHWRLANPPHLLHQFFEAVFVLQQPTYSSIYPAGQGVALAFGHWLFGTPWAGILISTGLLSAFCYWMLRAWTTPMWALVGGVLALMEFGPLNVWTNSYWGGALSGIAGCLVFGALPRLCSQGGKRNARLLGLGIGLEVVTRPFEAVLLVLCALLFLLAKFRARIDARSAVRYAGCGLLALVPALLLTVAQNKAVTRSWTTLPYMLSRYEYGVPTTFTFQPNPVPHRALTREQELDYRAQTAIHGEGPDSILQFLERWLFRLRYYRFFFFAPLYLAAMMFLAKVREWRFVWVLGAIAIFSMGTNFYPFFYAHYVAAITCLCVLVSVKGLEWISQLQIGDFAVGQSMSRLILFVCASQFLFWYGLHLLGTQELWPAFAYETWDFVNYGDPEGRIVINDQLGKAAGKQLVFIHYSPRHRFQEWIHNAADIDASKIVWANDLGAAENQELIAYFQDRHVWLLEPDAEPPRLTPYEGAPITSRQ